MTPANYWKQVREAEAKATPGPWTDGNYPDITTEDGCTAVLNSEMGFVLADDAEFIALSRTALPLALARIEELEAALESSRVSFHDQYCDVNRIRSPHGPCNCWCNEHNARIDTALGKP
jgi:hypothetical protein